MSKYPKTDNTQKQTHDPAETKEREQLAKYARETFTALENERNAKLHSMYTTPKKKNSKKRGGK